MDDKSIKEFIKWEQKFSEGMGDKEQYIDPDRATTFLLARIYKAQKTLNKFTIILTFLTGILVVLTSVLIHYAIH